MLPNKTIEDNADATKTRFNGWPICCCDSCRCFEAAKPHALHIDTSSCRMKRTNNSAKQDEDGDCHRKVVALAFVIVVSHGFSSTVFFFLTPLTSQRERARQGKRKEFEVLHQQHLGSQAHNSPSHFGACPHSTALAACFKALVLLFCPNNDDDDCPSFPCLLVMAYFLSCD